MSDGKKHSLRQGLHKKEFVSTGFVEETHGHKAKIFRFDPSLTEHLSLSIDQIKELDEYGEIITRAESQVDDIIITIIRRVLVRLPSVERAVLEKYYGDGHTVNEIAKEMNFLTGQTVNNVRLRAKSRFEVLFVEEKKKAGITADYNCCPICDDENIDALEERIHFWLDAKDHKLLGLPAQLKRQFGIVTTQGQIAEHIEYHMIVTGDRVEITQEKNTDKPEMTATVNLTIPRELKDRIGQIASPYHISYSETVRLALDIGVKEMQRALDINEEKIQVQLGLVKILSRVNLG